MADRSKWRVGTTRQVPEIDTTVEDNLTVGGGLFMTGQKQATVSADKTLAITDVGTFQMVDTDAKVITLPSTVVGYVFNVVNAAADGAALVTISPAAADMIMGVGVTAADNKDFYNTKATAKKGDFIRLIGDGVNGWYVAEMRGIWAKEG